MVVIKVKRDTCGGEKYLKNAVNYVGDGRAMEVRGYGVDPYNTKNIYDQMMTVKKYFGKTGDNPLMHFVISYDNAVTDRETASLMTAQIAENLSDEYQLLIGIHKEDQEGSLYHAHMIMNSVNYHNGKLYNSSPEEIAKLRDHTADVTGRTCRFYFE